MILNNERIAQAEKNYAAKPWHSQMSDERDYLDTIADLKRQLAERDKGDASDLSDILTHHRTLSEGEFCRLYGRDTHAALDAYVQEKVAEAVLAESEWWHALDDKTCNWALEASERLNANRRAAQRGSKQ